MFNVECEYSDIECFYFIKVRENGKLVYIAMSYPTRHHHMNVYENFFKREIDECIEYFFLDQKINKAQSAAEVSEI